MEILRYTPVRHLCNTLVLGTKIYSVPTSQVSTVGRNVYQGLSMKCFVWNNTKVMGIICTCI